MRLAWMSGLPWKMPALAVIGLGVWFTQSLAAQTVTYMVTVNTSTLSETGFLDFQFNPGITSQAATASISAFAPGGSVSNAPVHSGSSTGALPSPITLTNATSYNDNYVGFNFDVPEISFQVTFSGPAISTPNNSLSGSSFGFAMLASDGATPLLSSDPSGLAFSINVKPDGTTAVNDLSPNVSVELRTEPPARTVYVTNTGSRNLSVIDAKTDTVQTTLKVGARPVYVGLSPDGSKAYVLEAGAAAMAVIDTSTNKLVAKVTVGTDPVSLAISPDSSRIYVANHGSNSVSVIDGTSNSSIATVPVGNMPISLTVSADGTTVYVANSGSDSVSVIGAATNTVVATIPVGTSPSSIAVH